MKTKFSVLILFMLTIITLSGCSIQLSGSSNSVNGGNDGGIFRSSNKGDLWTQKVLIPTVNGQPSNFGSFDAYSFAVDPSDRKALYLGTIGHGLLYSYDGGDSWQKMGSLSNFSIKSIAIDPVFKCTIYVAIDNNVVKSNDCGRNFSRVYFDNDPIVKINSIAIDPKNGANVFIGTSRGEIIKSSDRGDSWQTINRFDRTVIKILISPYDSSEIFVATDGRSLHVSNNAGSNWQDLDKNLKDFPDSINFKDLVFSGTAPGTVYLASKYGLLKSTDYGKNWTKINLITPADKATINAVAVSPKNDLQMYYVTNTTFYRSDDGGKTWTTKKLPTTRAGWDLFVDPVDTNIIYMTARAIQK